MPKIAFIGAGSYGFTRQLVGDILTYPALQNVEMSFMDIDEKRLNRAETVVTKMIDSQNLPIDTLFSLDRDRVLADADFVINTVKIGMLPPSYMDIDLPKEYGLRQTIGDTACVAGVFRGLRTMPWAVELCRDVENLCAPNAVVLNYTNPQAMLVMATHTKSNVPFIGLCHSVQHTTQQVAEFLDVPYDEMCYEAAGINHMNWITKLEHRGRDLYPRLRSIIQEQGIHEPQGGPDNKPTCFLGPTRLDILNRTGYVITESSTHLAEYVPFYARTDELIEKYDVAVDQYKRNMERKARKAEEFYQKAVNDELEPVERSVEYGIQIINSMVTGQSARVYANVINDGLVDNLPDFSAVEVASLVDGNGVHPCRYGILPNNVAALCRMEINVHQLAVEAILEGDRSKVYQALMMDPLTHSVMSIDKIENMVDELVENQREWLGEYLN